MRSITITALAAAACALLLHPAYAQDSASSPSRAKVKAQTRAANEAGELAPAGPLGPEREPKAAKSNKERAPVKAETREAVKAGTIPRGEAPAGTK